MDVKEFIRMTIKLPEGVSIDEVMIPGSLLPDLLVNYAEERIFPVEIELEDEEGEDDYITDRCPICGSINVDKLDDGHDVCTNCHSIWEV